jgi:hypothetical protein
MRIGTRVRTEARMKVRMRIRVKMRMEVEWVPSIYLAVINKELGRDKRKGNRTVVG